MNDREQKRARAIAARQRRVEERAAALARPASKLDENATPAEELDEEISETLAAFKARAAEEKRRFAAAVDTEFWIALTFDTRAHKDAFLRALDLERIGNKYLDGHAVADVLRAELPPRIPKRPTRKPIGRWIDLAEDFDEIGPTQPPSR